MKSWFEEFVAEDKTFVRDRLVFTVFGSDGDTKDVMDDRIGGVVCRYECMLFAG